MTGIRVGVGDGIRRAWLLPVQGYEWIEAKVGGVPVYEGPDFEIIPSAGALRLDIIVFRDPPAVAEYIEIDSVGETLVFQTGEAMMVEVPEVNTYGIVLGVVK